MNSNINLVSSRNEKTERERKILLILRAVAVVLLTSIALISVIAFIITAQIPIDKIKAEQTQILSAISSSSKKLSSYYLIKDRLVNIKSLATQRIDYTEQIDLIFSKVPQELSVDSLNIESGQIEIEISGESLRSIDEVIASLAAVGTEGKVVKSVKLKSLSLNTQAGRYSVAFTAQAL